jgi:hypothetical protein
VWSDPLNAATRASAFRQCAWLQDMHQLGFGFGKGRRVIKTIITGDALERALTKQQRWFERHVIAEARSTREHAATLAWQTDRHRRMAKATLRPRREPRC